jgi:hypothetical protein
VCKEKETEESNTRKRWTERDRRELHRRERSMERKHEGETNVGDGASVALVEALAVVKSRLENAQTLTLAPPHTAEQQNQTTQKDIEKKRERESKRATNLGGGAAGGLLCLVQELGAERQLAGTPQQLDKASKSLVVFW